MTDQKFWQYYVAGSVTEVTLEWDLLDIVVPSARRCRHNKPTKRRATHSPQDG